MLSGIHNFYVNPTQLLKYRSRQNQYSDKGLLWREGRVLRIFLILGREEFEKLRDKISITHSNVNWKLL